MIFLQLGESNQDRSQGCVVQSGRRAHAIQRTLKLPHPGPLGANRGLQLGKGVTFALVINGAL